MKVSLNGIYKTVYFKDWCYNSVPLSPAIDCSDIIDSSNCTFHLLHALGHSCRQISKAWCVSDGSYYWEHLLGLRHMA